MVDLFVLMQASVLAMDTTVCVVVGLYLMSGPHQNVVGDFAKRQSQIDDVILRAATFREVADVHNSAGGGFSGWKRLQINKFLKKAIFEQLYSFKNTHQWNQQPSQRQYLDVQTCTTPNLPPSCLQFYKHHVQYTASCC